MKNVKIILLSIHCLTISLIVCSQSTWVMQTSGTAQHLNSIYASTISKVFAVGNNGVGLKTSDSGTNWLYMSLGSSLTHHSIRFKNSTTGYAVGEVQEVLETTNSGSSWTNLGNGATTLNDCYYTTSTGWVVGDIEVDYGFLYNPLVGQLIQIPAIANKVLRGIYFANQTIGWVVGDGGVIIKTTNSGTIWTQQNSGTTEQLNKIMFIDANNGIAVGSSKIILKTTNGGTNWTTVLTTGSSQHLKAVYYADALNILVCGDNGVILRSSDGGLTWASEISETTENLNAIHGIGITDIWACGNNGTIIYRSGSTSVSEINKNINVNISPNPHSNSFVIELNIDTEQAELKIFTIFGKLIYLNNFIQKIKINTENWAEGVYYYQISNSQNKIFRKGKIMKK